ncbi:LCP family protein [Streptomyces sp. NBC_01262]|uniref:LCP family protein n=1 Tax=Streptomyces sp. NBC_01262 TaxID=2903803 RepID=UPI002E33662D|nr:LCP family protein [Streptomyces sp. NBC_01262]
MSNNSDSRVRDSGWDDSLYEQRGHAATPDRPESAEPSAPPETTEAGGGGHRRTGRRPRRSRKARIIRGTAIAVSLAVLGASGAVWAYYEHLNGQIVKGQRDNGNSDVKPAKANAAGQTPMNILLLGSDSRNSAANLKLGGAKYTVGDKPRADVIMLMHLSADRKNMSVISIPRDTRVPIPECTDPDTGHKYAATTTAIINESLTRGGAGCTLATVQNLTNTYIDHWMVIDFAGVVKMADAIGGVQVCVRQNVWDHPTAAQSGGSGLKLRAGSPEISGKTALQWLRTRHAWGSDIGRAKAQHMYMTSMMRKLRKQNIFTDTGHLMNLAEAATSSLKVSEEIGSIKKLYNLGMQLKTVPNNRITMLTMPTLKDPQNPEAHLVPGPDASQIWAMLRNDIAFDTNGKAKTGTASASPTASAGATAAPAASIAVSVVNGTAGTATGTPVDHRAGTLVTALKAAGFTKATPDGTAQPSQVTTLSYPAADGDQGRADALAVAKTLDIPKASVKKSSHVSSITLIVGADWTKGTDYAKSLPSAGSSLANADSINGANTKDCMSVYAPYQW